MCYLLLLQWPHKVKVALSSQDLAKQNDCPKMYRKYMEGCIGIGMLMLTAYYMNYVVSSNY